MNHDTPFIAMLSEGMLTAILVAIPAILTAFGVIVVNIINALKKNLVSIEQKVDGLSDKRDEATQKSAFAEGVKSEADKSATLGLEKQISFAEGKAQQTPVPAAPVPVEVKNADEHPVPTVTKPKK